MKRLFNTYDESFCSNFKCAEYPIKKLHTICQRQRNKYHPPSKIHQTIKLETKESFPR